MSRMFKNYENNIDAHLDTSPPCILPPLRPITNRSNAALLTNHRNEIYGIEVAYRMPFTLYFHLDEMYGWPLDELIYQGTVVLQILTSTHKLVFEKIFKAEEIFTPANDLVIDISQEEAEALLQESYRINLTLKHKTGFYELFSENDGLLVVR